MRKIIFLDVDGVLNPEEYIKQFFIEDLQKEVSQINITNILSPIALLHLKQVIDRTNAKIILSSTWRLSSEKVSILERWFNLFKLPSITDYTPSIKIVPRGDEINAWLSVNQDVTRFVIIDDDNDMTNLMVHLVQCDPYYGLTKEVKEQAIKILNKN